VLVRSLSMKDVSLGRIVESDAEWDGMWNRFSCYLPQEVELRIRDTFLTLPPKLAVLALCISATLVIY
jgi:hypothetical protein